MSFQAFEPEGYALPQVPSSSVVVAGEIVAVAGQVAVTPEGVMLDGDAREQSEQVFANLGACLAAAGCTFADVFKVNGYLASYDDFPAYNEVYVRHFSPPLPARTTVQVGLYGSFKVEVELWARTP